MCSCDGKGNPSDMKQFLKIKKNREARKKCKCFFVKKLCKNCSIKNALEHLILKHLKTLEIKFDLNSYNKQNHYCQ